MTPEQLASIQARADAATEGPWSVDGEPDEAKNVITYTSGGGVIVGTYIADMVEADEDAYFIANARTDVPALLALVREQQERIGRVEDLCNSWDRMATTSNTQDTTLRATSYAIRAALTATEGAA